MQELQLASQAQKAFLVTTGKDYVRVPSAFRDQIGVVQMDVTWDDEAALFGVLSSVLGNRTRL